MAAFLLTTKQRLWPAATLVVRSCDRDFSFTICLGQISSAPSRIARLTPVPPWFAAETLPSMRTVPGVRGDPRADRIAVVGRHLEVAHLALAGPARTRIAESHVGIGAVAPLLVSPLVLALDAGKPIRGPVGFGPVLEEHVPDGLSLRESTVLAADDNLDGVRRVGGQSGLNESELVGDRHAGVAVDGLL